MRCCSPFRVAKFIVLGVVMCVIFGLATMLLWNALIPDLFHGPVITFWQAIGLLILSHILFRTLGGRGWHGGWGHHNLRHRFEAKLASMTPEERSKFKEEYNRRCCCNDPEKAPDTKK